MSNLRFVIVVVVLIGKPPLMGEVLCSTENSPFLIIDRIHAIINRVCCAALAIGKKCMNERKNKSLYYNRDTDRHRRCLGVASMISRVNTKVTWLVY